VLEAADQQKFPKNHVIIRSGELATSMFLVMHGKAKYYRVTKQGDEVLLWWLATDDAFGILTLLSTAANYFGTAQTMENCELLVWSREAIESLPTGARLILTQNALHIVLYYLAAYAERLVGLAAETAEQRLARTLLQLGRRVGTVRDSGIELNMMNEDLAGLADVSPFTASRQLKDWERQGILQKRRAKVLIVSPERLLID
jgi:CRP-like cAMP-binding protein